MNLNAKSMDVKELCATIKHSTDKEILVENVNGQRYIAAGCGPKEITLVGTPGNALGTYMDGANVVVQGNAQDATGDTMNEGSIVIHGNVGDAVGYAMRGGKIYVKGDAGYRAGIHMKAYQDKQPLIVIGGRVGSFLGEYQAGGTIVVLGLNSDGKAPVGSFTGTGMHGGRIILRCDELPTDLPKQVLTREATAEDFASIEGFITEYCDAFSMDKKAVLDAKFYVLIPDTKNPYKQLYCYA